MGLLAQGPRHGSFACAARDEGFMLMKNRNSKICLVVAILAGNLVLASPSPGRSQVPDATPDSPTAVAQAAPASPAPAAPVMSPADRLNATGPGSTERGSSAP